MQNNGKSIQEMPVFRPHVFLKTIWAACWGCGYELLRKRWWICEKGAMHRTKNKKKENYDTLSEWRWLLCCRPSMRRVERCHLGHFVSDYFYYQTTLSPTQMPLMRLLRPRLRCIVTWPNEEGVKWPWHSQAHKRCDTDADWHARWVSMQALPISKPRARGWVYHSS